jgi:hypothetical protein
VAEATSLADLFFAALSDPDALDFEALEEALRHAVRLNIHLPDPPIDSSISASYMRAFLAIQNDVHRLATKARSGEANAAKLTNALKRDLEINVVVSDGSANYNVDFTEILKKAIGKMTGRQVTIAMLGSAAMLSTAWGVSTWMETQKQVQIEQLRSSEHLSALEAMKFATRQDTERFERLTETMREQVEFGREIVQFANDAYREIFSAASNTGEAEINGQEVSAEVADLLTLSPKTQSEVRKARVVARVIDIRTEDILEPHVELQVIATGQSLRFSLENTLFGSDERAALFRALESGDPIEVDVELTVFQDDVRSTKFVGLSSSVAAVSKPK